MVVYKWGYGGACARVRDLRGESDERGEAVDRHHRHLSLQAHRDPGVAPGGGEAREVRVEAELVAASLHSSQPRHVIRVDLPLQRAAHAARRCARALCLQSSHTQVPVRTRVRASSVSLDGAQGCTRRQSYGERDEKETAMGLAEDAEHA